MRPLVALSAVLALGAPVAAAPPELALVPADALGVVHVRLADLWRNPALSSYRALVQKAGDKALASLDAQFVPPPTTLDRLTVIVLPPADRGEPTVTLVLRFAKPFDAAGVRAAYLPDVRPERVGDKEFYRVPQTDMGVHFADAQTLVFSNSAGMPAYLARKPGGGKLAEALAAAGDKPLVAAVNLRGLPLPPDLTNSLPVDLKPVLAAELATVTLSLDGGTTGLSARLLYATPEQATAADAAVRKAVAQVKPLIAKQRAELEQTLYGKPAAAGVRPLADLPDAVGAVVGLGSLAELEELLADLPLKRDGSALAADVSMPANATASIALTGFTVGLLVPAVQKVRAAAARTTSQNNLRQMGIAFHAYHDVNGILPRTEAHPHVNRPGKLSWRVALLPYLEQEALYKRFKLDEPWDSPHNRELVPLMPKVFADPRAAAEPGHTFYKAFVGPQAGLSRQDRRRIPAAFPDGTSNTFLVGAFGPAVPWTKPDDFDYDPAAELPDLFGPFGVLEVLFADGSVRGIFPDTDPKLLRALITPAGGEPLGAKDLP